VLIECMQSWQVVIMLIKPVINPTHHRRYASYLASLVMSRDYAPMHGEWVLSVGEMMEKNKLVQEHRAPRFRAYLDRFYKALLMKKDDWEKLIQYQDILMEIDISSTPMASLTQYAEIVGSFMEPSVDGDNIITIFRIDLKDVPQIINSDKYKVWKNLSHPVTYTPIVVSCSTCDDHDFRGFLNDYVIIIPLKKGEDHHLFEVPGKYKTILREKQPLSDNE
jgi:hypothetical protein